MLSDPAFRFWIVRRSSIAARSPPGSMNFGHDAKRWECGCAPGRAARARRTFGRRALTSAETFAARAERDSQQEQGNEPETAKHVAYPSALATHAASRASELARGCELGSSLRIA